MTAPSLPDSSDTLLGTVLESIGSPAADSGSGLAPELALHLPARTAVEHLAWSSVRAVCEVAGIDRLPVPSAIATAYRSETVFRIDDTQPEAWAPLSGFFRTSDGWIRTHANYPHHAAAMRTALELPAGATHDDAAAAVAPLSRSEAVQRIRAAAGLVVPVLPEDPAADARLRQEPLLHVTRSAPVPPYRTLPSGPLPLSGIRVLDLTRVIAGPVCTRTLALLGADVLRIDPPHLPEIPWQHLDTGHGKRSAVLDTASARFEVLLSEADVIVLGYRPASLARRGLSPQALSRRLPHAVIAQVSAWGDEHPERAGFDSLVQAASGIALIESPDGDRPGALPAQALDHSTGYLLAAAVTALITRRRLDGGGATVRTSLRRVAAELLGMPRRSDAPAAPRAAGAPTSTFDIGGHRVTTASPVLPGWAFAAPHPWGTDQPRW